VLVFERNNAGLKKLSIFPEQKSDTCLPKCHGKKGKAIPVTGREGP
jgi:hypothetical protein